MRRSCLLLLVSMEIASKSSFIVLIDFALSGVPGDIMNLISPLVKEGTTSIKTPNKASLRRALAMHASLPPKPTADGSPAPAPSPYIDAPVTEVIISHNFPENFIVHHPDVLIPMTSLAGSISCRRKPIIQGLLKGGGR